MGYTDPAGEAQMANTGIVEIAGSPARAVDVRERLRRSAGVVPWSRDAYVRRVWRIWRDCVDEKHWAYGHRSYQRLNTADQVAKLAPPPGFIGEHERLVMLVREHHRLRNQSPTPTAARELTAARLKAEQTAARLSSYATSEEQKGYAAAAGRLLAAAREDYATAAAAAETAAAKAIHRLARMNAPDAVAAEHAALGTALRAHLAIERSLHEASKAGDPDRVADALTRWKASVTLSREAFSRIADQLDFHPRSPSW
jgi:hypothetical protein